MREQDFPELETVYMDSACMSLRPESVIEAVREYYENYPVCPGRGNYELSERATEKLEDAREKTASFINADRNDLVMTSGTTESINTVADSFPGEKVIISDREHNSNLVPWQKRGYSIETVERQSFADKLDQKIDEGDLVSVGHVSNLDGHEVDAEKVSRIVRENDAYLMLDAAQSIPHQSFSVEEIDPDFVAFSGHKMCGPSGTGGLYVSDRGKEVVGPLNVGGGGVKNSSFQSHSPKDFPHSMESGLPNIAGFIGLGRAVDYLEEIGMARIEKQEEKLSEEVYNGLEDIDNVINVGSDSPGVISISIGDLDPHQASIMLDQRDIAVRSGMHCVHSWFNRYERDPTVRASLYLYNSEEDVERFLSALEKISVLG